MFSKQSSNDKLVTFVYTFRLSFISELLSGGDVGNWMRTHVIFLMTLQYNPIDFCHCGW